MHHSCACYTAALVAAAARLMTVHQSRKFICVPCALQRLHSNVLASPTKHVVSYPGLSMQRLRFCYQDDIRHCVVVAVAKLPYQAC